MAKICQNCNQEWPDDISFCPICGSDLKTKDDLSARFSLNLGDANAISGGIHMSDSHAVDSHDVHNVTHNTWVTKNERQKTAEEVYSEKLSEFRTAVRDAFEDGRITSEENRAVMSKMYELGIESSDASKIIEQERSFAYRRVKDRPLTDSEFNLLKITQSCVRNNEREELLELFDELGYLNARVDNGEVQYFYYMLYAALKPDEFIAKAKDDGLGIDCFWKTVWLVMADRVKGIKRSMNLDFKFHSYIENKNSLFPGNAEIAFCLNTVKEALATRMKFKAEILWESARKKFAEFEEDHQSFLNDLGSAIAFVINRSDYPVESAFYLEVFFPEVPGKKRIEADPLLTPLETIPVMPKIRLMENN